MSVVSTTQLSSPSCSVTWTRSPAVDGRRRAKDGRAVVVPADGVASPEHRQRAQRLEAADDRAQPRGRAIVTAADAGVQPAGRGVELAADRREAAAEVAGFEPQAAAPGTRARGA